MVSMKLFAVLVLFVLVGCVSHRKVAGSGAVHSSPAQQIQGLGDSGSFGGTTEWCCLSDPGIEVPVTSDGILLSRAHFAKAETGTLHEGKCSICEKAGVKSTVTMDGYSSCTAMYCGSGFYDEDGKFQAPKACNTCTTVGHCSRGHQVSISF